MGYLNDWHDVIRLVSVVLCVYSLVILSSRFAKSRNGWNVKTRDLWYALVMWSVTGVVLGLEGMIEDRPLEPRLVFYFLATLIAAKGIRRKGTWGGHDA